MVFKKEKIKTPLKTQEKQQKTIKVETKQASQ